MLGVWPVRRTKSFREHARETVFIDRRSRAATSSSLVSTNARGRECDVVENGMAGVAFQGSAAVGTRQNFYSIVSSASVYIGQESERLADLVDTSRNRTHRVPPRLGGYGIRAWIARADRQTGPFTRLG